MAQEKNERPNERLARHIVSTVLGVPVTRFEDGKANSQVDAMVHYADRVAALEVVADHEEAFNAQWNALNKVEHRIDVPGLRQAWSVYLQREAKISDVVRELPALLLAWQESPPPDLQWDTPPEMERIKIISARPMEGAPPGIAYLFAEGWSGASPYEDVVSQWVTQILTAQADVPAKLAAHPDAAERHAFIWATAASDYGVRVQLEPGDFHLFPTVPPTLPPGVSHVWVAGSATHQGVIAWFPERGWWRTPWVWPTDKPLTLDN